MLLSEGELFQGSVLFPGRAGAGGGSRGLSAECGVLRGLSPLGDLAGSGGGGTRGRCGGGGGPILDWLDTVAGDFPLSPLGDGGTDPGSPRSESDACSDPGDWRASRAFSTRRARLASLARFSSAFRRSDSATAVSFTGDRRPDDAERRPWTRVHPSSSTPSPAAAAVPTRTAGVLPSPEMEVEGEEGTDAAAAGGGATGGIDATGATLSGEAPEATTERPKDFSS